MGFGTRKFWVFVASIGVTMALSACSADQGGKTPAAADNASAAQQETPPPSLVDDDTGRGLLQQLSGEDSVDVVIGDDNDVRFQEHARKAVQLKAALVTPTDGAGATTMADEMKKDYSVIATEKLDDVQLENPTEQAVTPANLLHGYKPTINDTVVVLGKDASLANVVTAMAHGVRIELLPVSDVRASASVMKQVAEPKNLTIIAVGSDFGGSAGLEKQLSLAKAGPVPGGETGLVFPGRRMVALYGHPSGPALGAMGEQNPEEAVHRVEDLVRQYQEASLDEDNGYVPAFEIIATVASSSAGDDGDYSNESKVEDLKPYVDAIGAAGGYAILDLQPGHASFLDQAKRYQELLELPHVGLALDPEWKIKPDERPLARVGNTTSAEIDEVSDWLAQLVREKNLPQKILILHQFQVAMIEGRENMNVNHPELAFVLHADGHGTPEQKFDTWNTLREGLQPEIFLAWKNFIDEDTPMFDPVQTTQIDPQPWFVSYQ